MHLFFKVDVNVEGPERVVEEYHSPRVEVVIPEDPPLEVPIIKDKPAKSKRKPRTPKKCVRFEFDSPEKENSPERISAFLSPTSPIDEEIKRYEWDRQKQVEVSNLKRREKFQKARENIWATALNEMNSRLKVIQDEEEKKRVQLERELEEEQRREHQMQMNALQEAQKQRDLRRMASLQELEDIQIQKAQLIEESVVQLTFAMEAVGKAIDGHSGNTQSRRDVDHLLEEARVVLAKAEDTELATDVGIIETLIAKFRDCTNQLLEEKRCQQERLQREDAVRKKQAEAEQSLLKQQQLQQEEVAKVADQKKLEQERAEKAAQARAQQQQQYTQQQQQVASQAVTSAAGDSGAVSGASESNLKIYMTVLKEKADWQKNIAPLAHTSNPAEKTFKFACQKAVNVPVNGINATSSNHLQDKLEKLQKLLRGQDIEYSEGKQLNAAGNPCGIAFCKFLLAEKFIQQGEDVVSRILFFFEKSDMFY